MKKLLLPALLLAASLAACGSPADGAGDLAAAPPSQGETSQAQADAPAPPQVNPGTAADVPSPTADDGGFTISSDGGTSAAKSGMFDAGEGDVLHISVRSTIADGDVEFFLFDPDNNQHSFFMFTGVDVEESIPLSPGRWAYNCTGFFESGDFLLVASLEREA